MICERRACGDTKTCYNVENSRGDPSFVDDGCEIEGSERREFRRFQNDGASGCKRWGQLPRAHEQRVVPRHNSTNNTNRLTLQGNVKTGVRRVSEASDARYEAS